MRNILRSLLNCALLVGAFTLLEQPGARAGDPDRGEQAFEQCAACHSVQPGDHGMGPSLHGIVGRIAGTAEGFDYSDALRQADFAWSEETLDQWLADPDGMLPGNRMPFPGIGDPQTRTDLIAYLKSRGTE